MDGMDMSLDDLMNAGGKRGGRGGGRGQGNGGRKGKGRGGGAYQRRNGGGSSNFLYDDREGNGGGEISERLEWGPSSRTSRGGGPIRRTTAARAIREASAPYQSRRKMRSEETSGGSGGGSILSRLGPREISGTRMTVSNLHFDVEAKDLKELFETKGLVKKVDMKYDRSGRSSGDAEIIFAQRSVALEVIKAFNGRTLDGKELILKLVDEPTPEFDEDGRDTGNLSYRAGSDEAERARNRRAKANSNVREGLFGTQLDSDDYDDNRSNNRGGNRGRNIEPTFIVSLNGSGKKEFNFNTGKSRGGNKGRGGGNSGGQRGGKGRGNGKGGKSRRNKDDDADLDLDTLMDNYKAKVLE